jgi:outer membrane protein assembly factor BamB
MKRVVVGSWLLASALFVLACTNNVTTGQAQGAAGAGDPTAAPGAAGQENSSGGGGASIETADPSLNRTILTSKEEELVAIDASTKGRTTLFQFDRLVDVESVAIDSANPSSSLLYVGAGDNSINVIDTKAKSLLWDLPLGRYEQTSLSEPVMVVEKGIAYAVGLPGVLTAIDLSTKKAKWELPLSPSGASDGYYGSSMSRPTMTADTLYLGTHSSIDQNYLFAVDRASGTRKWRREIETISGGIKVVGDKNDKLLVPARDLLLLDAATGNTLWTLKMEKLSRGASTPIVIGGDSIFVQGAVGVAEGRLFCVSLASGEVRYEVKAGNDYAGRYSPSSIGNVVFGVYERGNAQTAQGNGKPFAIDAATGKILWENSRVSIDGSLVYANGLLYAHGQNFDGKGSIDNNVGLLTLDAKTGRLLALDNYFRFSSALSPIVIADNGIFGFGESH